VLYWIKIRGEEPDRADLRVLVEIEKQGKRGDD
jgi:hypothetical protein